MQWLEDRRLLAELVGTLLTGDLTPQPSAAVGIHLAVDGNYSVIGSFEHACVFDNTTAARVATLSGKTWVAISDNTAVADAGDGQRVYVHDATSGELLQTLMLTEPTPGRHFGGNPPAISGSTVVVPTGGSSMDPAPGGAAHLFDATTGALLRTLYTPTGLRTVGNDWQAVAISGNTVVMNGAAGVVYVLDASTGALLHT